MIHYAIGYVATAILFGLLDALWLRTMVPAVYRPEIGTLLMDGWRPAPALIFYALYMLGIQIFAVAPAIEAGRWQVAAQWGALFGFFCYMTYDLTNHATMKIWSTKVTLLDIAWGSVATGVAAGAAAWIVLTVAPRTA
ncbi:MULTISPECIES: DUF2177 family protein [Sphingopyxis]|jgi:uncharacterized membrane protein|uniref:Uncharacterized membrane protein n=1 Tax=Sphingopyxis terrae subsp. ummariensis TaxID=429001 RepID=A0A1Y6FPJ7_9SPHN|nr:MULTISPECIES: DUF2177 family protein [Sphingopyxis]MBN8803641.1 DUF2177 family protein [Sphingopyxis terrae]OJW23858.1 MAG: hypothetical protein BGO58_12530 [Sphingopyxis sp. 65-8]ENY83107.1 hypothetical protein EBMC1_03365 [Sphingopyxis sp. MC1]PCF91631.1 DUF2177 domain-containing protein [Sphingopyxis terrae subsp. ummariensis]SMQ76858.1 Uncharacterized membrane protein [Sphingopyxis terrae subsp. ummariensis]